MAGFFGGGIVGFTASALGSSETPIPVVKPPYTVSPGVDNPAFPYQFGIPAGVAPDTTLPAFNPGSKPGPAQLEQDPIPADGFVKPIKGPVAN